MLLPSSLPSAGSGYRRCIQTASFAAAELTRAGWDCGRRRCVAASLAPTPPPPFVALVRSVSVSYDERTSPSRTTFGVVTAVEQSVRFEPFRPSEPPRRAAPFPFPATLPIAASLALATEPEGAIWRVSGLVPVVELMEPQDDADGSSAAPSTEVEGVEAVTFESLGIEAEVDEDAETALPCLDRCRERDRDACRLKEVWPGGELLGDDGLDADDVRERGCRKLNWSGREERAKAEAAEANGASP